MCPHCQQNAPIVYRGILAYCTACGRPRPPLVDHAVNASGRTAMVGGTVTRIFGWLVLILGSLFGVITMGILQSVFPDSKAGYIIGTPISLASIAMGILLLFGGKTLRKSGAERERTTRVQAIFALAAHRGGAIRADEVGAALSLSLEEADALLTELAKTQSEQVSLEVDDQGNVFYKIRAIGQLGIPVDARFRVEGAIPSGGKSEELGSTDVSLLNKKTRP